MSFDLMKSRGWFWFKLESRISAVYNFAKIIEENCELLVVKSFIKEKSTSS